MKYENDLIDLFVKCKDAEMKKKVLEAIKKYAKWELYFCCTERLEFFK